MDEEDDEEDASMDDDDEDDDFVQPDDAEESSDEEEEESPEPNEDELRAVTLRKRLAKLEKESKALRQVETKAAQLKQQVAPKVRTVIRNKQCNYELEEPKAVYSSRRNEEYKPLN
jgi:hypothetical protein